MARRYSADSTRQSAKNSKHETGDVFEFVDIPGMTVGVGVVVGVKTGAKAQASVAGIL